MSEPYRALLNPQQFVELMVMVTSAVGGVKPLEDRIRAADEILATVVEVSIGKNDNRITTKALVKEPTEIWFGDKAWYGFKVALIQTITGNGNERLPATYGTKKLIIMPIAKELRMYDEVKKDTDKEGGGDFEVKLDEIPEEKPKSEVKVGDKVSLDEVPEAAKVPEPEPAPTS